MPYFEAFLKVSLVEAYNHQSSISCMNYAAASNNCKIEINFIP